MKPHHIGYLVNNMKKSIEEMKFLGYEKITDTIYDEYRDIDICFMNNNGYIIELVAPKSEKSVVAKLSKKIGVSPYHICYEVQDIDKTINILREQGYIPTADKQKAPAIHDRNAVFLYNANVGIIELVEGE